MQNSITRYAQSALPQFSGRFNYNDVAKMFLSGGYTSAAGNMYQTGLRISSRLAVKFDIGHGYAHSFLNGIDIFIWNTDKPKLVSQESFSCYFWSNEAANHEVKRMVKDYVRSQCLLQGCGTPSERDLEEFADGIVRELERETAAAAKLLSSGETKMIG